MFFYTFVANINEFGRKTTNKKTFNLFFRYVININVSQQALPNPLLNRQNMYQRSILVLYEFAKLYFFVLCVTNN
jgi:hypothetical protein